MEGCNAEYLVADDLPVFVATAYIFLFERTAFLEKFVESVCLLGRLLLVLAVE